MGKGHKLELERLGVLIGRTRSEHGKRRFVLLNIAPARSGSESDKTQPLDVLDFPLLLG
jgi:hypothetical protein